MGKLQLLLPFLCLYLLDQKQQSGIRAQIPSTGKNRVFLTTLHPESCVQAAPGTSLPVMWLQVGEG